MAASSSFDPELFISYKFPETEYTYTDRDAAIYALGVGACVQDSTDTDELKYVYHDNQKESMKVLPTFFARYSLGFIQYGINNNPGLPWDPNLMLHGQQYIEIYKPFPSNANILNKESIAGLHDKGKAAILDTETRSYVKESGELLCMNRVTTFIRGAGGFSNLSNPFSYSSYPANQATLTIPKGQPFAIFEQCTQPSQALLYRLSDNDHRLHSDPVISKAAGFSRPILHGLCFLGFAVRVIIKTMCKGDPDMVKTVFGRFLLHVYPSETLVTEMWLQGSRVIYHTRIKERNGKVLSGYVDLHHLPSAL